MRMTRQRILCSKGGRFAFIIGEAALHQVVDSAAIMAARLQALIGHAGNPRVDLSIEPLTAAAPIGSHGFAMFDRDSVMVETISAELTVTRPSEIAVYDDAFRAMHEIAARGSAAVGILARIGAEHEQHQHGVAD